MMKYLIIDDEPIAHTIIKAYCDKMPGMELMKHCYDALEALDYLREETVDLIFLDINMPKLKGFEFLKTLSAPPKVIVTTAYQEYALEGYELNVVDYLLKPFSFERFLKALNKASITIKGRDSEEGKASKKKETIFLYADKQHFQVAIEEILFVEAAGNYVKVYVEETSYMVREKISDLMEMLPEGDFIRVHKSFLVAKRHISVIDGNRIKIQDHTIPIGKLYKSNVSQILS